MDKVLLIATGGTIAMRKDEAGKVVPAVSGHELIESLPELFAFMPNVGDDALVSVAQTIAAAIRPTRAPTGLTGRCPKQATRAPMQAASENGAGKLIGALGGHSLCLGPSL